MTQRTPSLPTRIQTVLDAMSWTQSDLAEVTRASKQAVSRWLNDGQIKIDPTFAFRLEDATGFSARWLLTGTGPSDAVSAARRMLQQHESRVRDSSGN